MAKDLDDVLNEIEAEANADAKSRADLRII